MKKRILATLLALVFAFGILAACAPDDPPPVPAPATADPEPAPAEEPTPAPEPAPADDDRQLVLAGVVFQEDQFMRLLTLGFQYAAEAAGARFVPGNTNGDAAAEAEMIQTYLVQEFDGLAISPISEIASFAVLESASAQGLNIGISNHLFEGPWHVGSYSSDNFNLGFTVGKAAGQYIIDNLDGSASIALVQFRTLLPEQSGARSDGFLAGLDYMGVEYDIVTDQCAWMQDVAIETASAILSAHPDIDMIFSANEGGTIGSTMAVANTGNAGNVVVFGFDGSEQMVQLLEDPNNILQAVIAQDPFGIGVLTMEAVIRAALGQPNPSEGQAIIVPGTLLERANPAGLTEFVEDLREKMGS